MSLGRNPLRNYPTMEFSRLLLLSLVSALLATATCALRMPKEAMLIHILRPAAGSGSGLHSSGVSCASWLLGVEAHNVRDWKTIPASCEGYVGHYMLGDRYRKDSAVVVSEAVAYAESVALRGDGKEAWVFDVDETTLSNLPYYAQHGFGVEPYNATAFNEWVDLGTAPPLPESLKLYKKLISLGIKVIFLTGRTENRRYITIKNLNRAGYYTWEKLLLKQLTDHSTAVQYKSDERKKLEAAGYRIVGNIGDQWSDILGQPEGIRTFKLPDPMYYIG